MVVEAGAVPMFIRLLGLGSGTDDVRENAVWALGNIAGDSTTFRDQVLAEGVMEPLLQLLMEGTKLSLLRNATWALCNLCKGESTLTGGEGGEGGFMESVLAAGLVGVIERVSLTREGVCRSPTIGRCVEPQLITPPSPPPPQASPSPSSSWCSPRSQLWRGSWHRQTRRC